MLETAFASGCIDFILSPEKIAAKISEIAAEKRGSKPKKRGGRSSGPSLP